MAELHVGAAFALRTLAQAVAVAKAGDVVIVHAGTYREPLKPPAGTTWVAAPGETPVIDGGWNGRKMRGEDGNAHGVLVNQSGVVLRGFEVRNIAGRGVTVAAGGDNFLMEGCEIHHTLNGGFGANGTGTPIEGVTLRECHLHDICLSGQWYETPVNGCCLFKLAREVLVEDTLIERGYGEGIDASSRSIGVTFRRVTVRNTRHLLMYVNRSQNVLFENCVLYQEGLPDFIQGDGDVGAGLVVGDEESGGKDDGWQHAENVTMRGCLVVNAGIAFQLRNGTKPGEKPGTHDGYNTRIQGLVVERCTFVSGPLSKMGVHVVENDLGARVAGTFRRNVFVLDQLRDETAVRWRILAEGMTFENNVFTAGVPAGLPASNVPAPAAALAAPFAALTGGLDIDNYRPVNGGPLDGAEMGALEALPPAVEAWVMADFEQEPSAGPAPLAVQFIDRSTAGGNAVITTWAWEFGDGTTSVEPSPAHVYTTPGTYRARLTVADEGRALSYFVVGPEIVVAEVEPEPPEEPEPPLEPPDWAALRALAAEATAEMVTASMANDRAVRALQVLENRIREYELAAQGGEE